MNEGQNLLALREAVTKGRVLWHQHALERLLERAIARAEVLQTITSGEIIERHPDRRLFPSYLFLRIGAYPLHVVAAVDHESGTGHVVTAYRPDLMHFDTDFRIRRTRT